MIICTLATQYVALMAYPLFMLTNGGSMQPANVIEIHSQISTSAQESSPSFIQYPDIEAIKEWIHNFIDFKTQLDQTSNSLQITEAWNLLGPNLMLMSEDVEYATQVFTNLCVEAQLDLIKLPENPELAKASLESLMLPKEQLCVLLITDPQVLMPKTENSFVEDIHKLIEQSSMLHPVLIVTIACVETYANIDISLKRVGRFDLRIYLNEKSHIQYGQSFIDLLPAELRDESLITNFDKLGKLISIHFEHQRRMVLIAVNLRRHAKKTNTKITYNDVVRIAQTSTTNTYNYPTQARVDQVALHEAGHAAVAILNTYGANIPEFVSINPCVNYAGVMVDNYDYHFSALRRQSYQDLIDEIRTSLAGRVATQLYCNTMEGQHWGDCGDLNKANQNARDLIQRYALIPAVEGSDTEYSFGVLIYNDSDAYKDRVYVYVERLLDHEFSIVKTLLVQHRELLVSIYKTLMLKKDLFQEDLMSIWEQYPDKPIKKTLHKSTFLITS